MKKELKILGIYTWFHAYHRFDTSVCPVVIRSKIKRKLREDKLDQATVLLPWARQTPVFKSVWCSRALKLQRRTTLAMTLRLGDDQINSCWASPYGFTHSLGRRFNQYIDHVDTPYWFVAELKDDKGAFCPHIHGVIGLPRQERSSSPEAVLEIEVLKPLLRACAGDFDAARAVKLKPLDRLIGWSGYCSKQVAFTERKTGRSAYYFPHVLRRDARDLYESRRAGLKRLLRHCELPPVTSGSSLYVPGDTADA
jgi:hypothetical protein